ncbi:MAG: glycosyltransferase [Acidimicrobiales bacterium]
MRRIVLVTARWGDSHGESGVVLRLLAGALSGQAEVEVVSLVTSEPCPPHAEAVRTRRDSVFVVHEVPVKEPHRAHAGLLRAALAFGGGGRLPEISGPSLVELHRAQASGVVDLIASLGGDSVLLAGPETWWLPGALHLARAAPRVVSAPLLGDDPLLELAELGPLVSGLDAVGVLSRGERRRIAGRAQAAPSRLESSPPAEIVELDVAFAINRPAADQLMVGMSHFGRFVVLLTGFPEGSPAAERSPGHDYVRRLLGPFAVAEVSLGPWSVSDSRQSRVVPVKASRPNLWKLLAHAELCLDLRPQGIVGRETLESLLFGTPVVVPEGTVAAEIAEASQGGLWYRDYGELFDAAKAILDSPSLRARLSREGRAWAEQVHGDQRRFSAQAVRLAFG